MDPKCYPAGYHILLREAPITTLCTLSEREDAISFIELTFTL